MPKAAVRTREALRQQTMAQRPVRLAYASAPVLPGMTSQGPQRIWQALEVACCEIDERRKWR